MASSETRIMTKRSEFQHIVQQCEDNFDESEISSTIGTLEAGLRDVVSEVRGLHQDMDNIETEIENLKKRMLDCNKLAEKTKEWEYNCHRCDGNFVRAETAKIQNARVDLNNIDDVAVNFKSLFMAPWRLFGESCTKVTKNI